MAVIKIKNKRYGKLLVGDKARFTERGDTLGELELWVRLYKLANGAYPKVCADVFMDACRGMCRDMHVDMRTVGAGLTSANFNLDHRFEYLELCSGRKSKTDQLSRFCGRNHIATMKIRSRF